MADASFELRRDAYRRLVLTTADGRSCVGVVPVRAFPIAAPDAGLALVSPEGHEVAWVDRLSDLPASMGALVKEELAARELLPEIERIVEVSGFVCPSVWQVVTDRGGTQLRLKSEEDIRRLSLDRLMITDSRGIYFLVRDISELDRRSRQLLDRFL